MTNSQPPKDLIVMTRLNTVGLKRLAEGTLVEKKPFESRPPAPVRLSEPPRLFTPEPARLSEPPRMPAPPPPVQQRQPRQPSDATIEVLSDDDEFGADAEDRTIALGAEGSEDRTVAAPIRTPASNPAPTFASRAAVALQPSSSAPPPASSPSSSPHRLDMETPTALFVKDIQLTLQAELAKHDSGRAERMDAVTAPPPKQSPHGLGLADTVPVGLNSTKPARPEPTFELKFEASAKTANVPAPPRSKPASLAPPAKSSSSALPAPLHAQASRRKDPVATTVSTRPARIERKGGFLPWAAALTALGVFVGIAGARVATGAPFLHAAPAAAAPVAAPVVMMAEPGFAQPVAVPAAAPAEKAPEPAPVAETKPAEPVKAVEEKPVAVAAKVEEKIEKIEKPKAEPVVAAKVETKPRVERPRYRAPAPAPVVADKVEKSEEKVVTKAEKPEPAPAPAPVVAAKPKPEPAPVAPRGSKPDVAAAARDYAAVQSQLGDSL